MGVIVALAMAVVGLAVWVGALTLYVKRMERRLTKELAERIAQRAIVKKPYEERLREAYEKLGLKWEGIGGHA